MYIKIRVSTGEKEESLTRKSPDSFLVSVRQKPEFNLANNRVREIIAHEFKIPLGKVRIISGHHSTGKILSVDTEK